MKFTKSVSLFDIGGVPVIGNFDNGSIIGMTGEGAAFCRRIQSDGIEPGDVITAINGTPTVHTPQLMEQISRFSPGEKIKITYLRDNKQHTVTVTLYNSAGNTSIAAAKSMADLGCAFKAIKDDVKKQLGISNGIQVAGLKNGPFKDAGLKDGFIVLEVNGKRITSVDDMEKAYNAVDLAQ